MQEQIHRLLAPNRTEEIGYDVWEEYVIPPFFDNLTIGDTKKPRIIIGGRGCGKTMLLRYLSHESTFSPMRQSITQDSLSHIGLYWRSDTQFASLMQHRGVPNDIWDTAFRHLAAVVLGMELLRSLQSIAHSSCPVLAEQDIASLDLSRLSKYHSGIPESLSLLQVFLEDSLSEFESWVNNVRTVDAPLFLPGDKFLKRMIALIQQQVPDLRSVVFFVYIDEFENLAKYQQRIINTWLKHSEPPLVFNLAMKRNGFKTFATDGSESLSGTHDYRILDLEEFDLEREFPVFAGEILLLRLKLAGVDVPVIEPDGLRDANKLAARKEQDYVRNVQSTLKTIFPSLSQHDLALLAISDPTLKRRLIDRIAKALERHSVGPTQADLLLNEACPESSIILPALLNRDSLSIEQIKAELDKLSSRSDNKFTGSTNWIHNNFVGCYLQLFDGLGRPCPFYSGFETYCYMSHGNLRHFLELCLTAFSRAEQSDIDSGTVISIEIQAEAARQVSASLLPKIRSFGSQGNNLHTFVLRLGSLFSLSQQSPSQSEPERTHFAIAGGEAELDKPSLNLLSEAVKWSVLFEEKGTKKKDVAEAEGIEYILNPIYSPYFHISYRKRRKLGLSQQDIQTIISGEYNSVKKLLRDFQKRWVVDLTDSPLPLFAHLSEGSDE